MKESDIIEYVKNNLVSIFKPLSFIQLKSIRNEKTESDFAVDLSAELIVNKTKKVRLIFEVKSEGQPRFTRLAILQLRNQINQNKDQYGIFVAPFVSDASKQICKENNIGFMDLAGNYLFSFDSFYLNKECQNNPYVVKRPIKSIFSPKATRVIRVLLCNPKRDWYVQDLAKESEISIGHTSQIKEQLLNSEWLEEKLVGRKVKLVLRKPVELLQTWAESYSYTRNLLRNYYAMDDVTTSEEKVIKYFQKKEGNYAFTLTSGASRVAPFLRYNRIYFYLEGDIDQMTKDLGWKEVDSGPNITILKPYDKGVFYQIQEINHAKVVSNVQLYLDLFTSESRYREAAQYLLDQKLSKKW